MRQERLYLQFTGDCNGAVVRTGWVKQRNGTCVPVDHHEAALNVLVGKELLHLIGDKLRPFPLLTTAKRFQSEYAGSNGRDKAKALHNGSCKTDLVCGRH